MKTTTNYGLKKPESTDMYNIEDFNENVDKIDATLFELNRRANSNAQSATNAWDIAYRAEVALENHTRNKANPHNVTAVQIGLGNVNNTSDMNKPVSTAQQKALDLKADHEEIIGENLLPYPYATASKTLNGITWTVNGDGTITVNGTATAVSYFFLDVTSVLPVGTYTISGCPSGGGSGKYFIRVRDYTDEANVTTISNDYGNGATFTLTKDTPKRIYISVESGVTVNNLTFKPMLEKGKVAHEYQPYNKSKAGIIEQITVENLLNYPYLETTHKDNGVDWTDNGDGTVKANGTATAQSMLLCRMRTEVDNALILPAGTYTVSGCPKNGSKATYFLNIGKTENNAFATICNDFGDGTTFTLTEETQLQVQCVVVSGVSVSNIIFKPMLEKGAVAHPYQPYNLSRKGITEQMIVENLLPYPYYHGSSKTVSGITTTVDEKGWAHVKGTASSAGNLYDFTFKDVEFPAGTYTLSGIPKEANDATHRIWLGIYKSGTSTEIMSTKVYGNGLTFTVNEPFTMIFRIGVSAGAVVDTIYKPMLEKGSVAHPYTEYRKSHTKLREDLDTLMEDTGWILWKEAGEHTDKDTGSQYTVDSPLYYRIIRNQFYIRGSIKFTLTSGETGKTASIKLPDGISIANDVSRVLSCDKVWRASDSPLKVSMLLTMSEIIKVVTNRSDATSSDFYSVAFNECILLD